LTYLREGREKIAKKEKIVDERIFGRKRFPAELFCVARKNFFVNSRKGALAI